MTRGFRALAVAAAILAASAPLAAQNLYGNEGEQFLKAVKEGNGAKVMEMAEKPGSTAVNYRGLDGSTALHLVTRARNSNWVGYMLAQDADPNIGDANGDTPLILAARLGYSEGVSRLLMKKAQVDKGNKLGETALIVAVQARKPAIVRMLLEAGANPDKADYAAGYTARDYAKRDNRSTEILRLIEAVKSKNSTTVGPQVR